MTSIRSTMIWLLKQAVRQGMEISAIEKLLRLLAEEYSVNMAAAATRRAAPILESVLGHIVMRGPFRGMVYPSFDAQGSVLWTKIIGCYEEELHETIDAACKTGYGLIIDIGAAEGYYAVGFSMRCPTARIIAFEQSICGQRLLHGMIEANGVIGRVDVRSLCDQRELDALAPEISATPTLVLCDAEGSEYSLLDPVRLPILAKCDLIIELHRFGKVQPREWVADSFAATHDISFVDVAPRDPRSFPELKTIPYHDRAAILVERTDDYGWAILSSLSVSGR